MRLWRPSLWLRRQVKVSDDSRMPIGRRTIPPQPVRRDDFGPGVLRSGRVTHFTLRCSHVAPSAYTARCGHGDLRSGRIPFHLLRST
jgi:hypothetical protein